jgi:hypothetical protein
MSEVSNPLALAGHQRTGDGAQAGGQAPAHHQHGAGVDAHQAGALGVGGHGPQRQAHLGALQQHPQQDALEGEHQDQADGLLADAGEVSLGERRGHLQGLLARLDEDELGERVDGEEQAEGDDHHVERVVARLHGPDQQPFDQRAGDHREHHREQDGGHDAQPLVGEPPGDEGAEQGHLALGEVEQAGGAVDEHQGEAQRRVHRAPADAVEELVDEEIHQNPRYALRTASSAMS